MQYLIGTDEAGYGPNLGPLVVTATVWQVPDDVDHDSLYEVLNEVVKPNRSDAADARLCIADSKMLFKSGGGLAAIERGALVSLRSLSRREITDWRCLWRALCPIDQPQWERLPWYAEFDEALPIDACAEDIANTSAVWEDGLARAGVKLLQVQSRAVSAKSFNELLAEYGNKSSVLSTITIDLIRRQIELLDGNDIHVLCDKHGGRNRYGGLLQQAFGDVFVEVRAESRSRSLYQFGPARRRIEFCFQSKADHVLAAALSSMVSKYLRELAMRAFNHFWRQNQDDELRPTAGYPLDARRFKQQIAATQVGLGISDDMLWRQR